MRIVAFIVGQGFFGNNVVQRVIAQISRNRHCFNFAHCANNRPIGWIDRGVERHSRAGFAFSQCVQLNQFVGQHRDFVTRHIYRGHAAARNCIHGVIAMNSQAGRGNMDTDLQHAIGQSCYRQGIIDFGGINIVN